MTLTSLVPYVVPGLLAFLLTVILTPIVREVNRRLGMVDKPDPRRINKVPIPRGGGVALFVGVMGAYAIGVGLGLVPLLTRLNGKPLFWPVLVLSTCIMLLGLLDDRFGMNPKVKLLGQMVIALAAWWWLDIGFRYLWPSLPVWADGVLTVFWIAGAVNAFNLIDGLDGLASGLALIASLGMAGALAFSGSPSLIFFHLTFAAGLVGFLVYNYNPASIFLGDSGSMFIGFVLAILPLAHHSENSILVSVGVPLLAMGVPIFDTSLAILRRSVRRLIRNQTVTEEVGNDQVMTADSDHLHHRILRSVGLSQRKAAWVLYGIAATAVGIGLVGMSLKSRSGGLWLIAFTFALFVIFRDLARIELFDAGRLLNTLAHRRDTIARRRFARLRIPCLVVCDVVALTISALLVLVSLQIPFNDLLFRIVVPLRVSAIFIFLVLTRTYVTVWARALPVNYVRLFLASLFGSTIGSVILYYLADEFMPHLVGVTFVYTVAAFLSLFFVRRLRQLVRDIFYALDRSNLKSRKDVSRVLVYGCGLRYRAFHRELVRRTTSNNRVVVGLLDDDLLLRNHYIGDLRVLGTLAQAPEIILALNVDAVVIACEMTPEWMSVVRKVLDPTGVKISHFRFIEEEVK